MNILFYAENYCGKDAKGGTEVATFRIAQALSDTGNCKVFNAFRKKGPENISSADISPYSAIVKLSGAKKAFEAELADFISQHNIDVVVNMTRFFRHKSIAEAALRSNPDIKIFFMQHFAPGSEFIKSTLTSGRHLLSLNPVNPLYWLRASLYPLIKLPRNRKLPRIYKDTYLLSHRIILLSPQYQYDYAKVAGIDDYSKFCAIPNIFQPDEALRSQLKDSEIQYLRKKKKRVLILSRLDEIQKRLSLALKIWSNIEKDVDLEEWHLDIVGTGHNTDIVKKLIKQLKLTRVTLHGWQAREPFLREDSILMITSLYEGLPLSILEAQSYGCVPIAFNSFASLKDTVTPFTNGVIVDKFGDVDDYSKKLKDLMYDNSYREELALNAMNSSDRFTPDKIADRWLKILT